MKGYKVFSKDWMCRGFQYEVGKTYELEGAPDICEYGFHFCKKAVDCFHYYSFAPANRVAEIIALGAVDEEGDKCATNKIKIVREIPWGELLELVNIGKGNTGHSNSGNWNSGNHNSGDSDSGNHNSGNHNSGDWNSGNWNSGNHNSGDSDSGNWNSGNRNSGNHNSGDWNSGNWNEGDFCTGDFNTTDHATGCFCTEQHNIRFFDQETNMSFKEWRNSEAYHILSRINVDRTFTGWWAALSETERGIIKNIPNFDAKKFYQITGIKINKGE